MSKPDSVNGGPSTLVDQPNTGGGHVIISVPVKLTLNNGANQITFGSSQTSKQLGSVMLDDGMEHGNSLGHLQTTQQIWIRLLYSEVAS